MRRLLIACWLVAVGAVLLFNVRLYCASPLARHPSEAPPTLVAQLAANRAALDAGSPAQMQKLFPEGFYFSYVFHGLTWVELAMRDPSHTRQAIDEAVGCLAQLESPAGREPFPPNLPPERGMFYSAWKCSLRAGIVVLQQGRDPNQLRDLQRDCDAIAATLGNSKTPFPPSYENAAWPCDTLPAIHALAAYDRVTGENRYRDVIAVWLSAARNRLDPATGLFPHTAGLPDGQPGSVARATSQVVILRYLPDIDPAFARSQYQTFRDRFVTTFAGVPCVLEYPSGIEGPGDVDSGPLIFGRSPSATAMMMGIAQIYGDLPLADAIAQAGETVGMPWTSEGQKRYIGGQLPIGDIIVAHAHVTRPWFAGQQHEPDVKYAVSSLWRWKTHALSMVVLLPVIPFAIRRLRRKRNHSPTHPPG
ncbi:hypothetical protein [Humisphaera borealis]|uniref:Linalool dehydratase/isomerase domain-containing protein n=1 Tax=Humisphaera borealis TaxID=2807512 RepID=A0A7M2WS07_9BACT|nr:hypothetical protein [Humisphaera borealis]QOV88179.1 hypothetical protein IPV69_18220 [Humisphaera borealis]